MSQQVVLYIEEAAAHIGVPVNTLRFWRSQGTGPKSARIGRRVAYREADIEAWIEAQFDKAGPVG